MEAVKTDDAEFDLDVSFLASGPGLSAPGDDEDPPDTSDNCGGPEDSAGVTCPSAG
jgi:hypothetical protein